MLLDDSAPPLSPLDAARLMAVLCLAPREQLTIQRFGLACVRLREALASSSSSRYGADCRTALPYKSRMAGLFFNCDYRDVHKHFIGLQLYVAHHVLPCQFRMSGLCCGPPICV